MVKTATQKNCTTERIKRYLRSSKTVILNLAGPCNPFTICENIIYNLIFKTISFKKCVQNDMHEVLKNFGFYCVSVLALMHVWNTHIFSSMKGVLSEFDDCESRPCLNNGYCSDGQDKYTCYCTQGYVGTQCEIGNCEHPDC